jgi:lambda repressor-like predicted transcriptional regulator
MTSNLMDWSFEQIKAAMDRKGIEQAAIAQELGKSPTSIHMVMKGITVSDTIRRAIAAAIGRDVREIWPSAYMNPQGPPRRGRPKAKPVKLVFGTRK